MMRFSFLLAASVMMTGCTTLVQDPYLTSSIVAPAAPTVASEVSPEYAIALLPSVAGAARSVRQEVRDQQARQQIVYDNPTAAEGENLLTVEIGSSGGSAIPMRAPSENQLLAEMRNALPRVAMTISPIIGQNSHGVYGYATGAFGTSGSCIYAWQFIKSLSGDDSSYLGSMTANSYSAQVRLRYCSTSIGQNSIALFMQGLRVKQVNAETFSVLKFAVGSSVAARIPALEQPVPQPIRAAATDVAAVEVVRSRKAVIKKADEVKILSAAHVPMPSEPSAPLKTVELTPVVAPVIKKGVSVPLPSAVASH